MPPELPEVETVRRALAPRVAGRIVREIVVRDPRLRDPIAPDLESKLRGKTVLAVARRAKYLLFVARGGALVAHLGMSGTFRFADSPGRGRALAPARHDHFEIRFQGGDAVVYNDPRRFGRIVWRDEPFAAREPLADLGPEPLGRDFSGATLRARIKNRRAPIKSALMDSKIVAGVGNIYANEALFWASIHPARAAGKIPSAGCDKIVAALRRVLRAAIRKGGSTLRDFVSPTGAPGYFSLSCAVYGRGGAPCRRCRAPVRAVVLRGRATYFCPRCQRAPRPGR